jgi:hypothetical protein
MKSTRKSSKTRATRRPKRAAAPILESSVYAGAHLLGTIVGRGHLFKARTVEGRKLGEFPPARDAMAAIVNAQRQAVR